MQVSITAADTCSGTLQYCPELVGHSEGGTTGLAYVDKPVKPQHAPADCGFNVQYERVGGVPKYDYVSEVPLDCNMEGAGGGVQRTPATMPRRQSRRCFNCGSFLHSLKECPETRDAGAIAKARRENQQGRLSLGNERYFTAAPVEFADLKPGVLSAELRMALGALASADPPPWLHRMRELGYPPGYMTRTPQPNEQNGLVLHDDTAEQEINARKAQHVDDLSGCSGQFGSTADPAQRQCVAFPGINAPVPKEANQEKWGHRQSDLSAKSGQMPPRKRMRTELPRQAFIANPQHGPPYGPDAQAWTPQPPAGFYSYSPAPWTQQGCVTPPVAYPGGQPGSMPFYAPSLQLDPVPDSYSQSPGMGYTEYPAVPPSLPGTQQYGQIPQLFGGSHYHSGMHVHPMYSQAATEYPQAAAYGIPHSAGAGMLQEQSCGNGIVSPSIASMLEGLCAADVLEQEAPPPPPLPPETQDDTPPLPPPPPHPGF